MKPGLVYEIDDPTRQFGIPHPPSWQFVLPTSVSCPALNLKYDLTIMSGIDNCSAGFRRVLAEQHRGDTPSRSPVQGAEHIVEDHEVAFRRQGSS